MRPIKVGTKTIGSGHPCFIAAEIGINHNGDMALAHRMIEAAAAAGVDAVKFQNYETSDFLAGDALTHTYRNQGREVTESQLAMFKRCELRPGQLAELKSHCAANGIVFFSTPTNARGVRELVDLGAPLLKNGSDFLTNLELVRAMADTGVPTVLSTGMATAEEIDDAVGAFRGAGGRDLIVLHCTSSYPTPPEEINLRRIPVLAERYGCLAGFSDHSEGEDATVGAVAVGACFVEKHFTLDHNLPGPDHWFSSDREEMAELVRSIRGIEAALGSPELRPTTSEMEGRKSFRLSCVAIEPLQAGSRLKTEQVGFRRPGTGVAPKLKGEIVGRRLKRNIAAGTPLTLDDFDD